MYIDQFDPSSCLRHLNWFPWHQCCEHFHSVCLSMSLFSILVWCRGILLSPGVLVVLCWYPWLEVAKLCCKKLFGLTYKCTSPAYCSYIWLLPDLPYTECHVYPQIGCGISIPHLVGQLFLLFVQVWWSWWRRLRAVIGLDYRDVDIANRWALRDPKFQNFSFFFGGGGGAYLPY